MLPVCLSFAAGASFAAGLGPVDLPSGYEQVAYVESRGPGIQSDEHVDTGVLPNGGTTCRVGFAWLGGDTSGSFLLGSRNAFQDRAFYLSHQPKSNAPEDGFAFSRGDKIVYSSLHGNAYCEAELTATKKFTLDGVEIGDLSDAAAFDGAYPIWLFALNNAGTVKEAAKMRLYFCDIAEDGVPVRSFVPVRRCRRRTVRRPIRRGRGFGFRAGRCASAESSSPRRVRPNCRFISLFRRTATCRPRSRCRVRPSRAPSEGVSMLKRIHRPTGEAG